jgi:hypothetical protein
MWRPPNILRPSPPPRVTAGRSFPAGRSPSTESTSVNPAPQAGYWDALNESHDRTPLPTVTLYGSIQRQLRSLGRDGLAAVAEYLYDNDGLVSFAVDTIKNYSAPIIPMAAGDDPEINKEYDAYFDDWAKRADLTGRKTFWGLQEAACKALDVHGDVGSSMTDKNGWPQVQLIDSPCIRSRGLDMDGVMVDADGAVTGYLVSTEYNVAPRPVSANIMRLVVDVDLSSRYRGVSPIRRGANDVRDARDIKGFEKTATKIGAALAAVIEAEDGVEAEDMQVQLTTTDEDGNIVDAPEENLPRPSDSGPVRLADLMGGMIPNVKGKLAQLKNERPGERVVEMLGYLGACFVYGLGLPPYFVIGGDPGGPAQRSVNGQAQRKFNSRQDTLAEWVEWVYIRVIADGIARGKLRPQDNWDKMEWQGPPKVSIDEGRDAQAWRDAVERGLMTRQEWFANRQQRWKQQTDQTFAEDDYIIGRAQEVADKHKVPLFSLLLKRGYTLPTSAPAPSAPPAEDKEDKKEDSKDPQDENSPPPAK